MGLYSDLLAVQKTVQQADKKTRGLSPAAASSAPTKRAASAAPAADRSPLLQPQPSESAAGEQKPQPSIPLAQPVREAEENHQDSRESRRRQAVSSIPRDTRDRPVRAVRPVRRQTRRHAFDFYDDQIERLRGLSMQDRLQGGDGSMSRMVREAIDQFLKAEEGRTE
jgi:hypothetical protein